MIQRTLQGFLAELGYQVEVAGDGRAALERLVAGGIDLCLLDMGLPILDGMGVLQRYAEQVPDPSERATIVVVSARDDMRSTVEAVRLGAYDYQLKPLDLDRLQLTVVRALEQRDTTQSMVHVAADTGAHGDMLGRSDAIREVFKAIGSVAATRATVLVTGESGTGKEQVARAIHRASADADKPFVAVNCSAFARDQIEGELFGQVRGATGPGGPAGSDRIGRFELAGQGTLFLDEVSELPPEMQVKLLRVLQERSFERVGDSRSLRLEARLITATHRDLARLVHDGSFREELYYRLRVVQIDVPPLRERRGDIAVLVNGLLPRLNRSLRTAVRYIRHDAMDMLLAHDWPGNVRELENVLTRACVLAKGELIGPEHLQDLGTTRSDLSPVAPPIAPGEVAVVAAPTADAPADASSLSSLRDVERDHVARVLAATRWNKRRSCHILQITRPTLDRKIKEFGLEKPT